MDKSCQNCTHYDVCILREHTTKTVSKYYEFFDASIYTLMFSMLGEHCTKYKAL